MEIRANLEDVLVLNVAEDDYSTTETAVHVHLGQLLGILAQESIAVAGELKILG